MSTVVGKMKLRCLAANRTGGLECICIGCCRLGCEACEALKRQSRTPYGGEYSMRRELRCENEAYR